MAVFTAVEAVLAIDEGTGTVITVAGAIPYEAYIMRRVDAGTWRCVAYGDDGSCLGSNTESLCEGDYLDWAVPEMSGTYDEETMTCSIVK